MKSNNSQTNSIAGEVNSDRKQETKLAQDKVNEFIQKRVNEPNKRSEEKTKQAAADIISEYERKAKLTKEERITETQKRKAKKDRRTQNQAVTIL